MSIMTIIYIVIALGALIFIHELGHFLVARLFGVGVEKFSLGFGPRIFGWKSGITDYRVSAIPLGGYVKMIGEEPDAELAPEDIPYSFTHKHVFKRILIVAAGPVFNLLLAIAIYYTFFLAVGVDDIKPTVKQVDPEGPAFTAGIRSGDTFLSIGGLPVGSWYDINRAVSESEGRLLALVYKRDDSVFSADLQPVQKVGRDIFGDEVTYFEAGMDGREELLPFVGALSEGFPAQAAGIQTGDRIVAIDGKAVDKWATMQSIVASSAGRRLNISVEREGERVTIAVTPRKVAGKSGDGSSGDHYLIGISPMAMEIPESDRITVRFGPVDAMIESLDRTYLIVELTLRGFAKMIQGSVSRDNLGGPIMIAQMAADQAKKGIEHLIRFVAFISINLAILNFMPIPVLDGGHLLFFALEAVRGKPVNIRIREIAQQAGMALLLLLMIFVFYNDLTR